MVESALGFIVNFIINTISSLGYGGIILLMAIESALIPLPSEIIMPFSGFLVSSGKFNFWLVVTSGAVGNLIGSYIAYGIGFWGEAPVVRKFISKYGKFLLITVDELDRAEKFLNRHGTLVVFACRLLPAIRTVISLPCGMAKLPLITFSVLTFAGSFLWSTVLTYIGFLLGENWEIVRPIFAQFDFLIVGIGIIIVIWYIYRKLLKNRSVKN